MALGNRFLAGGGLLSTPSQAGRPRPGRDDLIEAAIRGLALSGNSEAVERLKGKHDDYFVYTLSREFTPVRVGHGEAYLLITVLACFLGGVDPFGSAGIC